MKKIIIGFWLAILILFSANSFYGIAGSFFSGEKIINYKNNAIHLVDQNKVINFFFDIKKSYAIEANPVDAVSGYVDLGNRLNPKVAGDNPKYTWVFAVWDFCLSLVNIALIGVLIFLGVVNVLHLNYDTYQLKKILLPLVIFVILANLSLFICRGILDFSDAITNTFAQDRDSIIEGLIKGLSLEALIVAGPMAVLVGIASGGLWGPLLVFIIIALIIGLAMLLLAGILYLREFIILLLAAVSPLAFAFGVLPATQGLFKKWWDWFLRWIFMGPIILLLLKIASIIGDTNEGEGLNVFVFVAVIGLMIAAIMVPWLLAGSVMGKLQGLATKAGGWAGKNVPGVSHAAHALGLVGDQGILGKSRANREKSNKRFGAAGYGLTEGGIGGMKQAWRASDVSANEEKFNKQQLVGLGGEEGLKNATVEDLIKMEKINPGSLGFAVKALRKDNSLDAEFVKKISQAAEGVKGLKGSDKEKLIKKIDYEIDLQQKADLRTGNPREIPNYLKKDNDRLLDSAKRNVRTLETDTRPAVRQKQTQNAIDNLSNVIVDDPDEKKKQQKKNKMMHLVNNLVAHAAPEDYKGKEREFNKLKAEFHVDFSKINNKLKLTGVDVSHHEAIKDMLSSPLDNHKFKENDHYHKALTDLKTNLKKKKSIEFNNIFFENADVGKKQIEILKQNWDDNKKKMDAAGIKVADATNQPNPPTL